MTLLKVIAAGTNHDGGKWKNTYFLETDIPVTQTDAAVVNADTKEWLERMYLKAKGIMHTAVVAVEFIVNVIDLVDGLETYFSGGVWTYAGTNTAQPLPAHDAVKVRMPALGFQRGKSLALPSITEDDNSSGVLTGAAVSDLVDFGAEFFAGPLSSGAVSYTSVLWRPTSLTIAPLLNTMIINSRIKPQGSRITGRGE